MGRNVTLKIAILNSRYRTQIHVATRAGIDEGRFSKIANGWVVARPDEQAAIAQVLGVSVAELFPSARQPRAQQSLD